MLFRGKGAIKTCYQSTWSHLMHQKTLVTDVVSFRIDLRACQVAVDFFRKNHFFIKVKIELQFYKLASILFLFISVYLNIILL